MSRSQRNKGNKRKKRKYMTIALIVALVITIIVSLIIAFLPNSIIQNKLGNKQDNQSENTKPQEKVEIVEIKKDKTAETTEKQAINASVEQFKILGEDVAEKDLKVDLITRNGEKFYYIKSKENSIMINVETGKIVRINSVSL